MKCDNCNQILDEDSIFCPFCGKRVERKVEEVKELVSDIQSNDEITNTSTAQNDNFNVIVENVIPKRNGVVTLSEILRKQKKIDDETSFFMLTHQPFTLYHNLTEEDAKEKVNILGQKGIEATISVDLCANDELIREKIEKIKTATVSAVTGKTNPKFIIAGWLSALSAILFVAVALLLLFIPIVRETFYETVDGEKILKTSNLSLLTLIIYTIRNLINSGTANYTYLGWLFLIFRAFLIVWTVYIIIQSIKNAIPGVKFIFKQFNKKDKNEDSSTNIASIDNNIIGKLFYSAVSDIIILLIVSNFGSSIIWISILFVGLFALSTFIMEKIAQRLRKQILTKHQN